MKSKKGDDAMETFRRRSVRQEAILQTVRGTTCHPTAEWVYEQLRPSFPRISLATVYRNLSQLRQEGLLVSVGTVQGQERVDGNTSPHAHFVCNACGAVLDLPEPLDEAALDRAAQETLGGKVVGHKLTFYGFCPDCEKTRKNTPI